jgi:hypothetical protein
MMELAATTINSYRIVMTVQAIQDAIKQLPEPERRQLADWFEELEAQEWDDQIERISLPAGRASHSSMV